MSSTATVVASLPVPEVVGIARCGFSGAGRLAALADRRVDVVHDRRRVGDDQVGDLGGVHRRAAADGDEPVDAGVERRVGGVLERVDRRLDARLGRRRRPRSPRPRSPRAPGRGGRWRRRPGRSRAARGVTPSRLSSQPASAAAPGPNLIGVASSVKTVSWLMAGSVPHVTGDAAIARSDPGRGGAHVLVDDDVRAPYETDWIRRWSGRAAAVVRPGTTEEVAAVLARVRRGRRRGRAAGRQHRAWSAPACRGRRAGGRRSCSRSRGSRDLGEVDGASLQVSAGAGVTLAALQQHARAAGLDAGVDFGARDSATLGGLAACDAGGIRALRHGTVRARIAGLEAVLADGTVVRRMSGLLKDNAGYDLPALLVGSEGTLGVITRVRWRLVPRHDARALALVPLAGARGRRAAAARGAAACSPRSTPASSSPTRAWSSCSGTSACRAPLEPRAPAYVLLEAAADADPLPELAAALEAAGIEDALIADDTASRERLWRLREAHTEAISAAGVPHKLDVGVPARRAGAVLRRRARGDARRRPHDPLRPPRRRQRPRQRARPRPGRRDRRRDASCGSSPSTAARSAPSTASASPRPASCTSPARPGRSPRCGRSRPRWTRGAR